MNTAVLGTPNKATGSPIKIGFVNDGKTEGIDHTPVVGAFKATVQYVNEYLGGLNGHVLEIDECSTNNTPTGATTCAVQMVNNKVAVALVPVSAQDGTVFNGLQGSGIPYVTYASANQDIILKPGAFILTNPVAVIAAPAKLAKDKKVEKVGFVLIDVPAATGPISAIAKPIFAKAGVGLDIIPVSPQVADMTPQVQQAIGNGNQLFTVTGTDEFSAAGIKALKQLGFQGVIALGTQPTQTVVDGVPGGLEGVINNTSVTGDPNDRDVQLYNAVMATYMKDGQPSTQSPWTFTTVLGFVRALTGVSTAIDAPSIRSALGAMPKPVDLPMGGGITFQCGAKAVSFAPNICAANVLTTTLDAQGKGKDYALLDVSQYLTLG